ncbi:MAG: TetR/AcrR family transcriptional regulator [Clostridia bacterium]|nr:TetR/AcrR family transcriptional regulator [Clostridia bacterium]
MENKEKRERTRAALKTALIALCDEKNYYDITIWDICNKADAYRSTFYRYFDTKDEMLREIEQEYLETTRSLTPHIRNFQTDASPEQMAVYLAELTADMEYHLTNERLCRFLLSAAGDIWFYEKMKDSITATSRKNLENGRWPRWDNMDYRINFFAAGFIDTIHSWLQKKDRTPEQMAKFLLEMLVQLRS